MHDFCPTSVTPPVACAPPVLVIGDAMTDVIARLRDELVPASDTAARIEFTPGGSAANVAAWLASLDSPVTFVGVVGDDLAGHEQIADLERHGVVTEICVDPTTATGTVVAVIDRTGERTMLTDRGANARLRQEQLLPRHFPAGGHFHLSGYVLLDVATRPVGLQALDWARQRGMSVSVDPNSAGPLSRTGAQEFVRMTRGATFFFPNLQEARELTGASETEEILAILTLSYHEVIVKLGAGGCVWASGSDRHHQAARCVAVVDTVGAGDAFAAGFLSSRLRGYPPTEALTAGQVAAARAVSSLGGRPAGP